MTSLSLTTAYEQLVSESKIHSDPAQLASLDVFEALEASALPKPTTLLSRFKKTRIEPVVQGVYLWGHVGRGKSMLMDLYFNRSQITPKRRIHFHGFMVDVHARIHVWRKQNPTELKTTTPIEPVAKAIASECRLLCLDELQVTDIADAMILKQLFETLIACGVKVVFTSNRQPEQLYQGGIQRDRFVAFVQLIREQFLTIELLQGEDYRMKQIRSLTSVYWCPLSAASEKTLRDTFLNLINHEPVSAMNIEVQGRTLHVPETYGGVAHFTFQALCEKALGAHDYITIAQHFNTVFISGIPVLSPEKRNEARRFVTLIDTLYEHKVKLLCTADALPEKLYPEGDGSFEFGRTVSRLVEMQSERYLSSQHQIIKIVKPSYANA